MEVSRYYKIILHKCFSYNFIVSGIILNKWLFLWKPIVIWVNVQVR